MVVDRDALNYPYIRVRSAEWLKRTLLIFPHVVRMTPSSDAPADDPEIQTFVYNRGVRGSLLRSARLSEPHVVEAQRRLIADLKTSFANDSKLLKRFRRRSPSSRDLGEAAMQPTLWERRLAPGASFQVHRYKMGDELLDYLRSEGLAWEPLSQYSDGTQYFEMNPGLGESIMATLAVACAENEALEVVTEFPELHGRLLGVPREHLLDAAFQKKSAPSARTNQIAEFLVYRRCNVDQLTAEKIASLSEERELLARFRSRLQSLAASIPSDIRSDAVFEERMHTLLDDLFDEWRRQANLGTFGRKFFGEGALSDPQQFVQKLVEGAVNPRNAGVALSGAVGGHLSGVSSGGFFGAAAGFAVAIVFRAAKTWGATLQGAQNSPYRYLSVLEDQGVSFSFSR